MTSDEDKEEDGNEEHDTSIVAFPGADDEYVEDHPPVPPGLRLDGSKIIDRDEADDVPASPPSPTRRRRNLTRDWMENFESMVTALFEDESPMVALSHRPPAQVLLHSNHTSYLIQHFVGQLVLSIFVNMLSKLPSV